MSFGLAIMVHYAALRLYSYRLCGRTPEADDLLQETICRALTNQHLFAAPRACGLKGWLIVIMHNQHIEDCTKRRKRAAAVHLVRDTTPPNQEHAVACREVERALKGTRHFAEMAFLMAEERHDSEIAAQLHIPVGTVQSRRWRARQHLKRAGIAP